MKGLSPLDGTCTRKHLGQEQTQEFFPGGHYLKREKILGWARYKYSCSFQNIWGLFWKSKSEYVKNYKTFLKFKGVYEILGTKAPANPTF